MNHCPRQDISHSQKRAHELSDSIDIPFLLTRQFRLLAASSSHSLVSTWADMFELWATLCAEPEGSQRCAHGDIR